MKTKQVGRNSNGAKARVQAANRSETEAAESMTLAECLPKMLTGILTDAKREGVDLASFVCEAVSRASYFSRNSEVLKKLQLFMMLEGQEQERLTGKSAPAPAIPTPEPPPSGSHSGAESATSTSGPCRSGAGVR